MDMLCDMRVVERSIMAKSIYTHFDPILLLFFIIFHSFEHGQVSD